MLRSASLAAACVIPVPQVAALSFHWILPMSKSKSKTAKSRTRNSSRETPTAAPSVPKTKRGTQHEANLRAILENRSKKPKLADLLAKKESAVQLREKLKDRNLDAIAKSSSKHARQLQREISKVESDYQARAEKGHRTRAAKAKGTEATLKALAGGRDQLRAHAKKLGVVGRSKMSVPELRSAVAKAAAKSGRLGAGMIAAPVAAALTAFDATKSKASASGLTDRDANTSAAKAAAVAGVTTAVATALIAKAGSRLLGSLAPGLGLALMAEGAHEGFQKHGPPGALFGALGLDDVAALAKHKAEQVLLPPPSERHEAIVPRSSRFAEANATFHAMQAAKQTSTNTLRGTQNPTNQAAIVANRQARSSR
jgi:hypothetical protein